ncbi:GNAT family N-acetyltransferase [Yinghuangia seranimata]|uniref:GNAT family N-acetyltransferase n=1 Tax=Yinghuangia seranimata TaxID=408067 RepID=UPI00248AD844|nr:GNAT family N-acetyltransferase [Yinghuangia seranimata]MDI2132778.1 GNAT family N-acetyltransferase [Yinghuangia seranimata]
MEWTCRLIDLAAHADETVEVQALAFGLTDDEIAVRRRIVQRHAQFPQVRALAAFSPDGRMIGFGYGYPNLKDQWWSMVIEPYLARVGHEDWLDDAFVVTELHVLPRWQGRGVGRTLLSLLCQGQERTRILLSAVEGDTPARRLYTGVGFVDLAVPVQFPGNATPYAVMGAELPLMVD